MTEDEQFASWLERLIGLYEYQKAGWLRRLNGARTKDWNDEGLHVWSHLWGGLDATTPAWLLDAIAEAPEQLRLSPRQLADAAHADALDEFRDRLLSRTRASGDARA